MKRVKAEAWVDCFISMGPSSFEGKMPGKKFSKRGLDREEGMGGPHYSSSFSPSLSHTVFCNDKRVGAFIYTNPEMIDCSPLPSSYIFQDLLAMRSLKL